MSEEKQIYIDEAVEEMATAIRPIMTKCGKCEYYKDGSCIKPIYTDCDINEDILNECDAFYNAGYRKQNEGEWIIKGNYFQRLVCTACGGIGVTMSRFCPNCGAKMKGVSSQI